jgi:hypothetical protein
MRRSRSVGVALTGLLVVAAISVAAGSGRKPANEQQAAVSLRRISGSEVMDIVNKFPAMVPARFASARGDTEFLKGLFQFSELTAPALTRAFPIARFYQGIDISEMPGSPYVMAIAANGRYMMPGGFNQLLLGSGLKVTNENIVELAEAFVISAIGNERYDPFPEITFLDARRINQLISGISYDAWLKVKVGGQVEEWYFDSYFNEFRVISRGNAKGLIKQYDPVFAEPLPKRGQLEQRPKIDIDTDSSDAYVEWQDATPHFYLTVDTNSAATQDSVRFSLSDFPSNAQHVYVRVRDTVRNATRLLDTVHIDGWVVVRIPGSRRLSRPESARWERDLLTTRTLRRPIEIPPFAANSLLRRSLRARFPMLRAKR